METLAANKNEKKMETNYFGNLTERMHAFRESVLNSKPYVCAERAIYTTESYAEHQDKSTVRKEPTCCRTSLST